MGRGDSSMPSVVTSSRRILPDKARVSPRRVAPTDCGTLQDEFAGMVARVESLRGWMGESTRQVEGLFESLLAQSFDGGQ